VYRRPRVLSIHENFAVFPEVGDRDAQIALYRKNLELIDQSRIWDAFGGDPGAVGPTELWRPLRPARSAEAEDLDCDQQRKEGPCPQRLPSTYSSYRPHAARRRYS